MNVWSKLITALRGGANELGEAVIDSQAMRILDQEIRDADEELKKAREALAEIMAKHKLAAERVKKSQEKVAEFEGYALKALDTGNEALALEVAEKIALLEGSLKEDREQEAAYGQSVEQLRHSVQQAQTNIKRLKQQVDTLKATETVQKAQVAVATRQGGSQAKLHTALESLERIKQKQAEHTAKLEASQELAELEDSDSQLQKKLREAGIAADSNSANAVLERLKAKNTQN